MKKISVSRLAVCFLTLGASLTWGLYAGYHQLFPFTQFLAAKKNLNQQVENLGWFDTPHPSDQYLKLNTSPFGDTVDTIAFTSPHGKAPLIVSLHTWSNDYRQTDPLAEIIRRNGWNYLRPDHQGPNNTPSACLSEKVIADIDAAIDWIIDQGTVDTNAIVIIGESGGGYTALGYRALGKHSLRHTFAWVPITDLESWYRESLNRHNDNAAQILGCLGGQLDAEQMRLRSPRHMPKRNNGEVTLYAGIHDGYSGTVPVSQSLLYYNTLAQPAQRIPDAAIVKFLSKDALPLDQHLDDRAIYLDETSNEARIVLFEGGHELLIDAAMADINRALAQE